MLRALLAKVKSLLVFTILTASTIGPGTVAMCSKAGADFKTALLWCVLVASVVAFVLQEGAGRLTLVGGASLGEAVRAMSPAGCAARARQALALFVVVGGFAYECNNFSGTMDAVRLVVPDPADQAAINVLLGPLCCALLLGGSSERIGMMLSVVVAFMIACFAATLGGTGLPPRVADGLVPTIPEGSTEISLALMATTSVPHNLLLSSSVARGQTLAGLRHGVLLASFLSGAISLLIQLVGAQAPPHAAGEAFSLADVVAVIEQVIGAGGKWGFALGLFGAGVSSALTVPFASALAVEDLLGLRRAKVAMAAQDSVTRPDDAAAPPSDAGGAPSPPPSPPDAGAAASAAAGAAASTAGAAAAAGGGGVCGRLRRSRRLRHLAGRCAPAGDEGWAHKNKFMAAMLILSLVPSLARLPFIPISLAAQMVNGLLLPCVASSMWLCLNHPQIMPPQSLVLNLLMAPCVGMTVFLAAIVVASNSVGRLVDGWTTNYSAEVAGPIALLALLLLTLVLRRVRASAAPSPRAAAAAADVELRGV